MKLKNIPKILVCAPQSDKKNYCFEDWYINVQRFCYPRFDVFLADNSDTNHNYKQLIKLGINCEYIKPKGRGLVERIALSHEACRQHAIKYKYDFMLHLETDLFPAKYIIESLLFRNKRIIGAMYHIFQGEDRTLMIQTYENNDAKHFYTAPYIKERAILYCDGKVHRAYSVGLGCVLIHKSIFKKIPFRFEKDKKAHPDTFWAKDIADEGIQVWCDTSMLCEHRNIGWKQFKDELY